MPEFSGSVFCQIALAQIDMPAPQVVTFNAFDSFSSTTDSFASCTFSMDPGTFTSLKGYVLLYPDPNIGNDKYFLHSNLFSEYEIWSCYYGKLPSNTAK